MLGGLERMLAEGVVGLPLGELGAGLGGRADVHPE